MWVKGSARCALFRHSRIVRRAGQGDAAALRQQVVTIATSAVGMGVDLLTAVQVRALIACLLWKQNALDRSRIVRPLAEWL